LLANGTLAGLAQVAEQNGTTVFALLSDPTVPHSDDQMAIEAGDAHDPFDDVTMLDLLEERVATSTDVSGYCEYLDMFQYLSYFNMLSVGLSALHPRHIAQMWPYRAVERFNGPFNSTLKNKILVATNTWDPVTPKSLAEKTAALLGDSAEYVEQRGHGVSALKS